MMNTDIGRAPRQAKSVKAIWVLPLLFVAADLLIVRAGLYYSFWRDGLAVAAAACISGLRYVVGAQALGLTVDPRQGWRYWVYVFAVLGMLALLVHSAVVVWIYTGHELPQRVQLAIETESNVWRTFVWMCIYSPAVEEVIYRSCLCPPIVAFAGSWISIGLSGALFAWLHVLYGNPSPDNLIGGFILAWAFVKSGTIVVPFALHALGNFTVLLLHAVLRAVTG